MLGESLGVEEDEGHRRAILFSMGLCPQPVVEVAVSSAGRMPSPLSPRAAGYFLRACPEFCPRGSLRGASSTRVALGPSARLRAGQAGETHEQRRARFSRCRAMPRPRASRAVQGDHVTGAARRRASSRFVRPASPPSPSAAPPRHSSSSLTPEQRAKTTVRAGRPRVAEVDEPALLRAPGRRASTR